MDKRPKDKQIERPTDREANRPKGQQTERPTDLKTERQTDLKTKRLKDQQTESLTDQKVNRPKSTCLKCLENNFRHFALTSDFLAARENKILNPLKYQVFLFSLLQNRKCFPQKVTV